MRLRTFLIALTLAGLLAFASCKTARSNGELLDDGGLPHLPETVHFLNREVKNGDFVEIPVESGRKIVQVSCQYSGRYRIKEKDDSGNALLNDEGKPRFKDGLYAHGYVVEEGGSKREVVGRKFISEDDTDNWNDLPAFSGEKLVIAFKYAEKFANDPEVLAANVRAEVKSVTVRYADEPDVVFEEFTYNATEDALNPAAKLVQSGSAHHIKFDSDRRVYRIDVNWGDAKPKSNGVYVPGRASGTLSVNGKVQDQSRNVGAMETQVWAPIKYNPMAVDTDIEIRFYGDEGRIHWVRVYYR